MKLSFEGEFSGVYGRLLSSMNIIFCSFEQVGGAKNTYF